MKSLVLFLFVILSASCTQAQNWRIVDTVGTYFYSHQDSLYITNIAGVDSVTTLGSDSTFHMSRRLLKCDTCTVFVQNVTEYFHGFKPELLGYSVQYLAGPDAYLLNGDTIRFKEQPPFAWDYNSSETASFSSVGEQLVFGVMDSIKVISISNGDSLIISKNHGLVTYADSNSIYSELVGFQYRDFSIGEYLPNVWSAYDFTDGDKFCFNVSLWSVDNNDQANVQLELLEDLGSTDEFEFVYHHLSTNYHSYGWANPPPTDWNSTTNKLDTISFSFNQDNLENALGGIYKVSNYAMYNHSPYKHWLGTNPFGQLGDTIDMTSYTAISWKYDPIFGYIKEFRAYEHVGDNLYYEFPWIEMKASYANNLGKIGYTYFYFEHSRTESLNAFDIDGDSYGTLCDLPTDLGIEGAARNFEFYPNPTSGQIQFSSTITAIDIYTLNGKLIQQNSNVTNVLDIQLEPGLYIIRAEDQQGQVFLSKLIVL